MFNRFEKVRARAPLRLGLAGGGTDLSPYCDLYGGAVLNVTIDRHAFASISAHDGQYLELVANDLGIHRSLALDKVNDPAVQVERELMLLLAAYRRIINDFLDGAPVALRIETSVDAPPGSGLGSSSALVIALVEALAKAFDLPLGQYEVARLAYEIERVDLQLAGGKQDQYASAFGGVNFIEFLAGHRVVVNPLRIPQATIREFESSLVIGFTGLSRASDAIIRDQIVGASKAGSGSLEHLHGLKEDARLMKSALLLADFAGMARILNGSWQKKKETSKTVSNSVIEEYHRTAMANGAVAGKISGAGGGGFMMFMVDPCERIRLIKALTALGGLASPVMFTSEGAHAWYTSTGKTRPRGMTAPREVASLTEVEIG